ncbi:hypothetical protein NM688_g1393 [Phlebia brevispora]|uniref:Uncharacterized protein n=1 Tax=Phlebia brevispora TaxID=194682 RepID=A0ACC1TBN4_9APHY|nr:hypothetical protein NM688_g1393 [Phlebia brevispora]
MPASRLSTRRRKSSLGIGLSLAQPGNYGLTSPRPVTFAPNVTPGTYVEDADAADDTDDASSPTDALFPPAHTPEPMPSRRRVPPGKRRSQGYIPRPPNAFMLFRADFVRQKHVPGSIETNHGSLSKIIGNIWTNLPPEQKEPWNKLAKKKKAEHKQMYPNYRFRPVHNKNKSAAKRKEKPLPDPTDERRCEQVAHLLLEGKKGAELTAAVRQLEYARSQELAGSVTPPPPYAAVAAPTPIYAQRRPSSVPPPTTLYNPITIPTVPFLAQFQPSMSRPDTPVGNIARSNRYFLGQRRASSTGPTYYGTWNTPQSYAPIPIEQLQRDDEPLPDVNAGLFNSSFGFGINAVQGQGDFSDPSAHTALALSISPLDHMHVDPLADPLSSASTTMSAYPYGATTPSDNPLNNTMPWMQQQFTEMTVSGSTSPSAFSASPSTAPSEVPVVPEASMGVYAPQPEHPQNFHGWDEAMQQAAAVGMEDVSGMHAEAGLGLQPMEYAVDMQSGMSLQEYACGLDGANVYTDPALEAHEYSFHGELAHAFEPQPY